MINTAQALYEFWSGFGLPAYTQNTIPDEASVPYITYSLPESEPISAVTHYAQVWYRDTSNVDLLTVVDAITAAIRQGIRIDCDGGYVALRPSSPYVQLMTDEDPAIRRAYINLQLNCYHK